jgi:hypothetical protein
MLTLTRFPELFSTLILLQGQLRKLVLPLMYFAGALELGLPSYQALVLLSAGYVYRMSPFATPHLKTTGLCVEAYVCIHGANERIGR